MSLGGWRTLAVGLSVLGAGLAVAADAPDDRRSGFAFMSRDSQALQSDDTINPGMLWVLEGESLWGEKAGKAQASCADCHGDAPVTMKGVAARYPAFSPAHGGALDLQGRVNACRQTHQDAEPLAWESRELLALTTYVARQSRTMPVSPPADPRLQPARARGEALYRQRLGQFNFSCADCHDDNWGRSLGGAPIPQAHPTGYPLYRLEWQELGSLQRRMRNCMVGVRAEPYPYGASELVALEVFLMARAHGMPMESPAVRP